MAFTEVREREREGGGVGNRETERHRPGGPSITDGRTRYHMCCARRRAQGRHHCCRHFGLTYVAAVVELPFVISIRSRPKPPNPGCRRRRRVYTLAPQIRSTGRPHSYPFSFTAGLLRWRAARVSASRFPLVQSSTFDVVRRGDGYLSLCSISRSKNSYLWEYLCADLIQDSLSDHIYARTIFSVFSRGGIEREQAGLAFLCRGWVAKSQRARVGSDSGCQPVGLLFKLLFLPRL